MTSSQFVVRYGATRFIGEFSTRNPEDLPRNSPVIIRSERGVEWGIVLSPASDRTREYLGRKSTDGKIVRPATAEDRSLLEQTRQKERDEFDGCAEMIRDRRLNMQLVDVEHLFGGERVVFYYLAEDRVDFRELVKELAKRFKTRIEMRQIGVRDEAKLLADYGDCGKPVCCNTHLSEMPPVSMKMAKLQKATLDPTKISGRCGRLKCCLRYEYDMYEKLRKELPRIGTSVVTDAGRGTVLGHEILASQLLVQMEDMRRVLVDAADILSTISVETSPN
ncbi:MAG: regulatory iron-sulfur-containing complex subunit RicT [Planctomycetota bacterium]|nr:regulatory iron-sulfur-containing complex subunit RicT [Planctomycetota bacterium]